MSEEEGEGFCEAEFVLLDSYWTAHVFGFGCPFFISFYRFIFSKENLLGNASTTHPINDLSLPHTSTSLSLLNIISTKFALSLLNIILLLGALLLLNLNVRSFSLT